MFEQLRVAKDLDLGLRRFEQVAEMVNKVQEILEPFGGSYQLMQEELKHQQLIQKMEPYLAQERAIQQMMESFRKSQQLMQKLEHPLVESFLKHEQTIQDVLEPYLVQVQKIQQINDAFEPLMQTLASVHNSMKFIDPFISRLDFVDRDVIADWDINETYWTDYNDFPEIVFNEDEGTFVFDGKSYSSQELSAKVDAEIEEIRNQTQPISFDEIKRKYWLTIVICGLIWYMLTLPPTIDNAINWHRENGWMSSLIGASSVAEETNLCVYVWTISERTRLRDEPNAEGTIMRWLPIETELRVISDVPRWYEVEYTTKDGELLTGWVPKRYVERAY